MDNKTFSLLWGEALAAHDLDLYVAEWSTSSIWGNMEDLTDDDLLAAAAKLTRIWEVAHVTVKEICKRPEMAKANPSSCCISKDDLQRGLCP